MRLCGLFQGLETSKKEIRGEPRRKTTLLKRIDPRSEENRKKANSKGGKEEGHMPAMIEVVRLWGGFREDPGSVAQQVKRGTHLHSIGRFKGGREDGEGEISLADKSSSERGENSTERRPL